MKTYQAVISTLNLFLLVALLVGGWTFYQQVKAIEEDFRDIGGLFDKPIFDREDERRWRLREQYNDGVPNGAIPKFSPTQGLE